MLKISIYTYNFIFLKKNKESDGRFETISFVETEFLKN